MQPDRFRLLLTSRGPYGSVYFDDSHDTEDADTQIELKWRALREQLEQQGAEPALTESIEAAIAASRPAVGAVETLIIGDIGDATVVAGDDLATVAPNENVLSELGTAPAQVLRAVEALPMLAVSTGAALVRTDERIAPRDGVAAVLRYALR